MQTRTPEILEFCDLSYDLDARLRLLADLAQATESNRIIFDDCLSELGNQLLEYLGKRVLLEHVFFGRNLKLIGLDHQEIKAEIWRLQKIRAAYSLKQPTPKKTEKRTAGRI
jgi:hypothetical protein